MIEQDLKKPDDELVCTLALTWRIVLWIVWGAWWGGLSFYAVVVVPIGTELIGSVEQGFITQRVTMWHNCLAVLFLLCLAVEAYSRKSRVLWVVASRSCRLQFWIVSLQLANLVSIEPSFRTDRLRRNLAAVADFFHET